MKFGLAAGFFRSIGNDCGRRISRRFGSRCCFRVFFQRFPALASERSRSGEVVFCSCCRELLVPRGRCCRPLSPRSCRLLRCSHQEIFRFRIWGRSGLRCLRFLSNPVRKHRVSAFFSPPFATSPSFGGFLEELVLIFFSEFCLI